jgi:hypothetical protein
MQVKIWINGGGSNDVRLSDRSITKGGGKILAG